MNATLLVLSLGLPAMLLLRVPLALAIGLATIAALWTANIDLMIFAQRMVAGTQSFSLLAIPFFVLAGDLMTAGGISRRLVSFADVLVRHRTGGLGMVCDPFFWIRTRGLREATLCNCKTILCSLLGGCRVCQQGGAARQVDPEGQDEGAFGKVGRGMQKPRLARKASGFVNRLQREDFRDEIVLSTD